jgi:MerR family transcriptional regulator/heat shock protein HspR
MSSYLPDVISEDLPIFTVSVAAKLAGMHPQTLRTYDRLGLVVPSRAKGSGRRYSPRDVKKLRLIQHLSQEEGINLNGIKRIIELNDELEALRARTAQLAELIQELLAESDFETQSRVFTAGRGGDVWTGRHRVAPLLALPSAG